MKIIFFINMMMMMMMMIQCNEWTNFVEELLLRNNWMDGNYSPIVSQRQQLCSLIDGSIYGCPQNHCSLKVIFDRERMVNEYAWNGTCFESAGDCFSSSWVAPCNAGMQPVIGPSVPFQQVYALRREWHVWNRLSVWKMLEKNFVHQNALESLLGVDVTAIQTQWWSLSLQLSGNPLGFRAATEDQEALISSFESFTLSIFSLNSAAMNETNHYHFMMISMKWKSLVAAALALTLELTEEWPL